MKLTYLLFLAAPLLLAGCRTDNMSQEAFNRDLVDGTMTMTALQQLDRGNTNELRQTEIYQLGLTIDGMAHYGDHVELDPKLKDVELALARQTLDYLSVHRRELDPRSPMVQGTMHSLRQILTDPADVQKLNTLSDYLTNIGQMRSVAPDVP